MLHTVNMHLYSWHKMKAKDVKPLLDRGIELLKQDPDKYRAMNPENGWGSYDEMLKWLHQIQIAVDEYPEATVSVT